MNGSLQDFLGCGVGAVVQILEGSLKHVPLAKGDGERLDLIRHLVHPNIEEWLAFFHDFLLQEFAERFDLGHFFEEDQVLESLKVVDTCHCGDLALRALSHLGFVVDSLLHITHNVLDDFLHKDAVVTFCSHT